MLVGVSISAGKLSTCEINVQSLVLINTSYLSPITDWGHVHPAKSDFSLKQQSYSLKK